MSIIITVIRYIVIILYSQAEAKEKGWWKKALSIYEFTCKDIDGNDVIFGKI